MREQTLEMIRQHKVIAILRGLPGEQLLDVAQALYEGGVRLIEVTFSQSGKCGDTAEAIHSLSEHFRGKACIGAGTVMTEQQLDAAHDAGAQYIISPHTDADIVRQTRRLGLVSMPGALTPTEIAFAHTCGADIVKLFPADTLGIEYIKAVRAPLSHIPLAAVGGVNEHNLRAFLEAGVCCVGVGSNIVKKSLLEAGDYAGITRLAALYAGRV